MWLFCPQVYLTFSACHRPLNCWILPCSPLPPVTDWAIGSTFLLWCCFYSICSLPSWNNDSLITLGIINPCSHMLLLSLDMYARQPALEFELTKGCSHLYKLNGSGQVPFILTWVLGHLWVKHTWTNVTTFHIGNKLIASYYQPQWNLASFPNSWNPFAK